MHMYFFFIYFCQMEKEKLQSYYREQQKWHAVKKRFYKKRLNTNAILRLFVFIATAVAFYYALKTEIWVVTTLLTSAILIFIAMVQYSSKLDRKRKWHTELEAIYKEELDTIAGNFSQFEGGTQFQEPTHSFSYDLDIFGDTGFFQTINRTARPGGMKLLANQITNPLLDKKEIENRQKAFQELAHEDEWRQSFKAHGRIHKLTEEDDTILKSLHKHQLKIPKWIHSPIVYIGIPVLTISTIILSAINIIPIGHPILAILIQWAITGFLFKTTQKADASTGKTNKIMAGQRELIRAISQEKWESDILIELQKKLNSENPNALQAVDQLARIMNNFEYRNNFIVNMIINSLLLWDVQCLTKFDKWHKKSSSHFKNWMETLDTMDAWISCGGYVQNNPDFAQPIITNNYQLNSIELGHPLLPANKRVNNNYKLDDGTSFHIVTGANMAGKSTFLRTVSLNMVMAMSGLPVCAKSFEFSPVNIFTSMRTTDSLSKDESYFYAELRRLREAYDRIKSGERLFIVLDEILKGTNSEDKRKGSMDFLKQLVKCDVSGIIATHDTQLSELENLHPEIFKNYCFEIEIDGDNMQFDYKLLKGVTKTMNAQLLMKQMGLIQ
jgi:DNA mismatch repair ATPase MutS